MRKGEGGDRQKKGKRDKVRRKGEKMASLEASIETPHRSTVIYFRG